MCIRVRRMPSAELEKAVNERGFSSRTMRTAKSRIGDLSLIHIYERTSLIFHWLYLSDIFPKPESGQSERKQSPC